MLSQKEYLKGNKMPNEKLPEVVHVMREEDGDDSFLLTGESLDDLNLERDKYITVGKYVLEGTQEVTLKAYVKEEN